MGFILWLVMGAVVGWVASLLMGTGTRRGTHLSIVVGIAGATLGGFVSLIGGGTFTPMSFGVAMLGAVLLLGLLRAVREA